MLQFLLFETIKGNLITFLFSRNMLLMYILILLNNKINIFFQLKLKNSGVRTKRTNYQTKVSLADIFINHLVR